jgi:hypothetical protein
MKTILSFLSRAFTRDIPDCVWNAKKYSTGIIMWDSSLCKGSRDCQLKHSAIPPLLPCVTRCGTTTVYVRSVPQPIVCWGPLQGVEGFQGICEKSSPHRGARYGRQSQGSYALCGWRAWRIWIWFGFQSRRLHGAYSTEPHGAARSI